MSLMFRISRGFCGGLLFITLGSCACGCDDAADQPATQTPANTSSTQKPAPSTQPIIPVAQAADWCREHGVPESICAQCDPTLVAEFKAKGDWDEQHNVPKSQCFQCDPSLKEKFVTAYTQKHGKAPPTDGAEE